MALTIPKQQFTGTLGSVAVSAPVAVPMQQVVGAMSVVADASISAPIGIPMMQVQGAISSSALDASFAVPMQAIYGIRPEMSATVGIPMQQVQGAMFQPILAIPMQQMEGAMAVPLVLQAAVAIPMQVFQQYKTANIAGQLPGVASAFDFTAAAVIAADLVPPRSSIAVLAGLAAVLSGAAPGITSSFTVDRPAVLAGKLPGLRSAMSVTVGAGAALQGALPLVAGAMHGLTGAAVAMAGSVPAVGSTFAVDVVGASRLQGGLPGIRSSITAMVGRVASINGVLPMIQAAGMRPWVQPTIVMQGTMPAFAARLFSMTVERVVRMVNFNIKLAATTDRESSIITQSVAALGEKVYAAGPGGVYLLAGDTDDGAAVAQRAVFANMDYGTGRHKFPESAILEARAARAPNVTVRVEGAAYTYPSQGPKMETMYRAKLGRGIRHKRLQFEVSGTGIKELASVEVQMAQSARGF